MISGRLTNPSHAGLNSKHALIRGNPRVRVFCEQQNKAVILMSRANPKTEAHPQDSNNIIKWRNMRKITNNMIAVGLKTGSSAMNVLQNEKKTIRMIPTLFACFTQGCCLFTLPNALHSWPTRNGRMVKLATLVIIDNISISMPEMLAPKNSINKSGVRNIPSRFPKMALNKATGVSPPDNSVKTTHEVTVVGRIINRIYPVSSSFPSMSLKGWMRIQDTSGNIP